MAHIDIEGKQKYYTYQKALPKKRWPKLSKTTRVSMPYNDRLEVIESIKFDSNICPHCGGKGLVYKKQGRKTVGTICKTCNDAA
jgi:hypothetical protein